MPSSHGGARCSGRQSCSRGIARIRVVARSNAGVELDFKTGILYTFDGSELSQVISHRTWDEALSKAGISDAEAQALERESVRVLQEASEYETTASRPLAPPGSGG